MPQMAHAAIFVRKVAIQSEMLHNRIGSVFVKVVSMHWMQIVIAQIHKCRKYMLKSSCIAMVVHMLVNWLIMEILPILWMQTMLVHIAAATFSNVLSANLAHVALAVVKVFHQVGRVAAASEACMPARPLHPMKRPAGR